MGDGVSGPLQDVRFRRERGRDKGAQLVVGLLGNDMQVSARRNRSLDATATPFFERDWPARLTGGVFDQDRGRNA